MSQKDPAMATPALCAVAVSNLNHAFGKGALRKPVLLDVNLDIYPETTQRGFRLTLDKTSGMIPIPERSLDR